MTSSSLAIMTAAIAAAGALAKKFLPRPKPKPEYIPRAEFHAALDHTRDRIDSGYTALADKIDSHQRDLLSAIDRQGASFEKRLDTLDAAVARLDERTAINH